MKGFKSSTSAGTEPPKRGMVAARRKSRRGRPSVDWSLADWNLRDTDIAIIIGVTRERVRQVRLQLKKPPSPIHRSHPPSPRTVAVKQLISEIESEAGRLGISRRTVSAMVGFHIKSRPKWKAHQKPINWRLPNTEIERIWKLPSRYVSNTRTRLSIGPPAWDRRKNQMDGLAVEVAAEEVKARKWLADRESLLRRISEWVSVRARPRRAKALTPAPPVPSRRSGRGSNSDRRHDRAPRP